jgi:hypothetical protein
LISRIADLEVSAASGLLRVGDELWVAADDELDLLVCDRLGRRLRGVPLVAGSLPGEAAARKALKLDFEAMALLPDGSVLVLGSGSRPSRRRGVRLAGGTATEVDLEPLYVRLESELPELNIEGAAMAGGVLRLLSRGNGPGGQNAVIDLDPASLGFLRLALVELGDLDGVRLGFTDATPAGEAILFSAAAEASPDTYRDGPCGGSVLGLLEGASVSWTKLVGPQKIEGITRWDDELLLVTDADDRSLRAGLYRSAWPL